MLEITYQYGELMQRDADKIKLEYQYFKSYPNTDNKNSLLEIIMGMEMFVNAIEIYADYRMRVIRSYEELSICDRDKYIEVYDAIMCCESCDTDVINMLDNVRGDYSVDKFKASCKDYISNCII